MSHTSLCADTLTNAQLQIEIATIAALSAQKVVHAFCAQCMLAEQQLARSEV